MLSRFLGVPVHLEVILIAVTGICVWSVDTSVSTLRNDLQDVWTYPFDDAIRAEGMEEYIKYILSGIVILKALTLHLFLALHFLLLWVVAYEEKANLILPWLLVGLFRSFLLNGIAFLTGLFVCLAQKGYHEICVDYTLAQSLQHGPEVYAWLSIYSYYKILLLCSHSRLSVDESVNVNRRSLPRLKYFSRINFVESIEDERNVITESTIANLVNQMKRMKSLQCSSRSLDALTKLHASKLQQDDAEMGNKRSIPERVMCLLNVVWEDIDKAKTEKENRMRRFMVNDFNLEKLLLKVAEKKYPTAANQNILLSSIEMKPKTSFHSVYEEPVTNEVEMGCISLTGSNVSCFLSENQDVVVSQPTLEPPQSTGEE